MGWAHLDASKAHIRRRWKGKSLCLGVLLSFYPCATSSGDWPGLLGQNRDGYASSSSALSANPPDAQGLLPKWELPAGEGYAGAAIRDGQVALFQRDGREDVLRLVRLADGKVLWRTAFPAAYKKGIDDDTGPRSVPQILDDAILVSTASGGLHYVARADGRLRWSRDLRREMGAEEGYFGAGNSPLVVGSLVVVNVGAKKRRAGIVGLSVADGKTVWQATDADAGYASPILIDGVDASGKPYVTAVVPTRLTTYGIDPLTGSVRWEFPFGQRGPTVNAATPVVTGSGRVFQTSSYGIGFVTARTTADAVEIVQRGDDFASQYATPVAVGDYVYGSDGREDLGSGAYKCLNVETGEVAWKQFGLPICHTIAFRDAGLTKLLLVGIDGQLFSGTAQPESFQQAWKTRLPMGKYRALPAYSKNRLVVRTSLAPDAKWSCFEW